MNSLRNFRGNKSIELSN